ncbi:hypothetical protein BH09BAC6_BH09BAC6_35530 [soil metagenome]
MPLLPKCLLVDAGFPKSSAYPYLFFYIRKITCKLYMMVLGQKFCKYLMKYYVILLKI